MLVSYDLQLPDAKRDDALLAKVRAFLASVNYSGTCLVLDPSAIESFEATYEIDGGVPMTRLLDANGKVLAKHDGQGTRADFEAMLERLPKGAPR